MMTLNLAVRNLLRNRRRSLATLLAMAIGSTSILLFGGYSTNINYSMHTAYVQTGGHLQIQHRDFYLYGSGNPTAYGIADYTKILAAIQNDEGLRRVVLVATPTLQFGGIAGNYAASVSRTIIGKGFVAEDINRMRRWDDFNLGTSYPVSALEGSAVDAAIVGTGVARVLQLCDALKISRCPKPEKEQKSDGASLPADIAQLSLLETPAASAAAGADRIREFSAWKVFAPSADDVLAAIAIQQQSALSFWDAMIVRAAAETQCDVLWTEDLNDGQSIRGVRIRNPFLTP